MKKSLSAINLDAQINRPHPLIPLHEWRGTNTQADIQRISVSIKAHYDK